MKRKKKSTQSDLVISNDYRRFIEELKIRVANARISAARRLNQDLILLYWDIGRGIVEKQQTLERGDSVVERVPADLRQAFPSMSGFSPRNLRDMKRFFLAYSQEAIWRQPVAKLAKGTQDPGNRPQAVRKLELDVAPTTILRPSFAESEEVPIWRQLVAEIPWGQNLLILNKLIDPAARLWQRGEAFLSAHPVSLCRPFRPFLTERPF